VKHLNEEQAALLAGGELPLWKEAGAHAHAKVCASCRAKVSAYRKQREELHEQVENFRLPKGFDWAELESEMIGNIRLGAEVASVTPPPRLIQESWLDWRGVVAISALSAVVVTGWFLTGPASRHYPRIPGYSEASIASGNLELKGNPTQVGLQTEKGRAGLYFRSTAPTATRVEVVLEGSLRSASVDQESGQLTVTQVSVAQEDPVFYEE
jgi:hypothetical protein